MLFKDAWKSRVTVALFAVTMCVVACLPILVAITLSQETAAAQLRDTECGGAQNGVGELIAFLEEQSTDRTDPKCIEKAIETIGSARAEKAIPILLRFLDFAEPLSNEEESHRMVVASSHYGPRYKAVEALFKIGAPAIPFLTKLINDPSTPSLKVKNALASYVAINRENLIRSLSLLRASGASELCPALSQADNDMLITFLERSIEGPQSHSSGCIGFAILQLGISKSVPGRKVLLSYLQYELPSNNSQAQGTESRSCPICHNQRFPAVTALALIGTAAAPDLLELLKNGSITDITRQNAVEAIMLLYSESPQYGIRLIRSYADRQDQAAKERLEAAAHSAQQWCDALHRASCAAALEQARHSL